MMADFMNISVSATMLYCVFDNCCNMFNIILPQNIYIYIFFLGGGGGGLYHERLITLTE